VREWAYENEVVSSSMQKRMDSPRSENAGGTHARVQGCEKKEIQYGEKGEGLSRNSGGMPDTVPFWGPSCGCHDVGKARGGDADQERRRRRRKESSKARLFLRQVPG